MLAHWPTVPLLLALGLVPLKADATSSARSVGDRDVADKESAPLKVSVTLAKDGVEVVKPVFVVRTGQEAELTVGKEGEALDITLTVKPYPKTPGAFVTRLSIRDGDATLFEGALVSRPGEVATVVSRKGSSKQQIDLLIAK